MYSSISIYLRFLMYYWFCTYDLFPNQPCAEGVLADLKASDPRPPESLHFGRLYARGFLTTVTHLCSKVDDPLRF